MAVEFNKKILENMAEYVFTCSDIAKKLRDQGLVVEKKSDGSRVTNVDKELDVMLSRYIKNMFGEKQLIISEEDVGMGNNPVCENGGDFWSIDPIDSTKSLIEKGPYYTINIAYISNNIPVMGIICAPEINTIWYGAVGVGCFKKIGDNKEVQIYTRVPPKEGAILMSSEEQITTAETLKELNIVEEIKLPSSIKFCYVAEGKADYYVRKRNKACDWDISSGHALILSAGGHVVFRKPDEDFLYGKPPYLAPSLLAMGHKK